MDFVNLVGFSMFHTYVYNKSLDGNELKAKQILKNNLNVENENYGISHKLMLQSSELGTAGRCSQVMQLSIMRL